MIGSQQPQWASINNGAYICVNCASVHRGLGNAEVKSLTLDIWSELQLRIMILGGNKRLKEFFAEFDLLDEVPQNRYKTNASDFYRRQLKAEAVDHKFE